MVRYDKDGFIIRTKAMTCTSKCPDCKKRCTGFKKHNSPRTITSLYNAMHKDESGHRWRRTQRGLLQLPGWAGKEPEVPDWWTEVCAACKGKAPCLDKYSLCPECQCDCNSDCEPEKNICRCCDACGCGGCYRAHERYRKDGDKP